MSGVLGAAHDAWVRGPLLYWRWRLRRAGRKSLLMYLLGLVAAVEFFESAMFVFGATYIMGGVDAEPQEFVHVQATYAIGAMIGLLLQQRLVHRFGFRRYLFASILLFLLGMLGCANSNSIGQMAAARLVLGMGGGVFFATGRILLPVMFRPAERALAIKRFLFVVFGTSALAPAYAAWVIERWGWAWTFYGALPGTFLIGVGVLLLLPDNAGRQRGARLVGEAPLSQLVLPLLWFVLAAVCLETAFSQARLDILAHPMRLGLLCSAGLALLAGFLWRQWRHPLPLLHLKALHNPVFLMGLGFYFVYYFINAFIAYLFPIYAERGLGFPLVATGWLNSLMGVATLFMVVAYMLFISARMPKKRPVIATAFFLVVVSAFMLACLSPDVGMAALIPALLIKGASAALVALPVGGLTFSQLGDKHFAHGYQSKSLMRQVALTFATALAAVLLQNRHFALNEALAARIQSGRPGVEAWLHDASELLVMQGVPAEHVQSGVMELLAALVDKQAMFMACQNLYLLLALVAGVAVAAALAQRTLR
ncbi:MAG: MFS transporter [Azoarcus sp.]|jgi:MFS family permease|nr:MFS transporter [Azoarcus sp.]